MQAQPLLKAGNLNAALTALQDQVRKDASNVQHRIFLFQLLAVMGQWNRALTQLNVAGELDAAALPMVQTYREAIQCEALRQDIFSGARAPLIFGKPPAWLGLLLQALKSDAAGDGPGAASMRGQAFALAPATPGTINGEPFEWIGDADQRLGPVLEVILNGRYFWVPMQRIRRIEFDAPVDLRDAVWTPASFTWTNGAQTVGLIPTRYNDTVASGDDALLLSRRTDWLHDGAAGARGVGQRMLASDTADHALMDARVITFELDPDGELDSEPDADAQVATDVSGAAPEHG